MPKITKNHADESGTIETRSTRKSAVRKVEIYKAKQAKKMRYP